LEDALALLNITVDPLLLEALQLATSNDTTSSMVLVVQSNTAMTAVSPPGSLTEPDPGFMTSVASVVEVKTLERQLTIPLGLSTAEGAAGLCSIDAGASYNSTTPVGAALALLQAVADAAGVPASWVTLKCKAPPGQTGQRRLQVGFIGK
jgi:hypothetical protein